MILTKTIDIKINSNNYKYLISKGYKNFKNGDVINIKVENLSNGSNSIIKCKCDVCGIEKFLMYRFYIENFKNHNIYTCHKCSKIKNKLTCKEKYNNENYNNRNKFLKTLKNGNWELKKNIIYNKMKKTCLDELHTN